MYITNQGKIMRKWLGKPATEPSTDGGIANTSAPLPAVYRPNTAQNATYAAGVPIACFDKAHDGRSAILGGRHILKAVRFEGLRIRETVDLRAYISASSSNRAAATTSTSDQLSIQDVKWATWPSDNTIFTACANGRIFQYDLAALGARTPGGAGLDYIQMREDTRQVNTLDVNPHRGTLLLSGSQEGHVRYFDIRAPVQSRSGATFQAVRACKGNGEAISHVKWSPKDGLYFACATESGSVVKWDLRTPSAPVLRLKAHDKSCTSISWHPDGDHLISAGSDNKCHVWDVYKTADKRQKPKYTISTAAPVAAVSWRPGQWSATNQALRAAQVAITYDESSQKRYGINAVHIWDLGRPTMPYKEIVHFDCSPASLLWHDQDLLWTVGQDGLFSQCDVAFATRVIDRTTVSTMAFSARGDVMMFLDERLQPRRPRPPVVHADLPLAASHTSSPGAPMLSISRSDSEDDVVGSFLGPRRRAGRKRRMSTRSATALSTTPPSGSGEETAVVPLPQALNATGLYKLQQVMGVGPVPSTAKANVYGYLSASYLETLERGLPYARGRDPMPKRVAAVLAQFAKAAENVSQFRLAQTWRILAYAFSLLLVRRAQYHRERRGKRHKRGSPVFEQWDGQVFRPAARLDEADHAADTNNVRQMGPPPKMPEKPAPVRSLLAEEIESTSNMPTPLARPIDEEGPNEQFEHARYVPGTRLAPVLEVDGFALPPSVRAASPRRRRLDSVPLSEASQGSESTQASIDGYDFYDAEALAKAINVPRSNKTDVPASFVAPGSPAAGRKPVMRHDSDESFAQMFSISQTSGHSNSSGSSAPKALPRYTPIARAGDKARSDLATAEYQSRIRGKEIDGSPGSSQLGYHPHRALQRTSTEITGMTGTTDEDSQKRTQTSSGSLLSQEVPFSQHEQLVGAPVHKPDHIASRVSAPSDDEDADGMAEHDYLPWPGDPPYPHPIESDDSSFRPPLDPYTALKRAMQFETRSSALNAAAMVLLLKPLVPDDVVDSFQAASILRQHHSRLMGMKLFVEAALLRKMCLKGWPGGVLCDWGEDYPAISTQAQHAGFAAAFLCPKCRKPREIDRSSKSTDTAWQCERCRAVMGPCAVCGHREANPNPPTLSYNAPDASLVMSTWWYCHGCGHGGHSTCLEGWHSAVGTSAADGSPLIGAVPDVPSSNPSVEDSSGGCCPLDGCGHACLPGRWRVETNAARSEELTRVAGVARSMSAGERDRERKFSLELGVRSDSVEVGASRAVESVRESLTGNREVPRASALSSSPGRGSLFGERERRKSVKFAGTEERR